MGGYFERNVESGGRLPMKPRILVYALGLADIDGGKFAGNYYHVFRLVTALARDKAIDLCVLVDEATVARFSTVISAERLIIKRGGWGPGVVGNELAAMYWSFRVNPDLFHRPGGQLPLFPIAGAGIMGIADINFRDLNWGGIRRIYKEVSYHLSLLRSTCVVTISAFTARRVRAAFGLGGDKLMCIHLGAETDHDLELSKPAAVRGNQPFWLCLGHRANKNLELAVAAYTNHRREGFDCRLIVLGDNLYSRGVIEASGIAAEIDLLPYVTEAEFAWLYAHACGLLFPSHYEGFGLPILEAMRSGCPVLASEIEVHREVAGPNAADLLPLGDVKAWSQAMAKLMKSPAYREERVQAGRARAQQFTWAHAARKTVDIYLALDAKRRGVIV